MWAVVVVVVLFAFRGVVGVCWRDIFGRGGVVRWIGNGETRNKRERQRQGGREREREKEIDLRDREPQKRKREETDAWC